MAAAHDHAHSHDHAHAHPHDHGYEGGLSLHGGVGGDTACCAHDEYKLERHFLVYLLCAVLLIGTRIADWVFPGLVNPQIAVLPALVAALIAGGYIIMAAYTELRRGAPGSSCLAALGIIGCIALGRYEVAGWVALILLVVDQFLRRTAVSARTVIEQLIRLTPGVARLVKDGQEVDVPVAQIKVGDVIRVRAGENLPIDGVVISGRSTLDQASLTGEAMPHEVAVNAPVYAGTTNLSANIDIRATQVGGDTTIGKVTELIRQAERTKTPRQLIIEQVSRFYVPVVLGLAFIVWFLTPDSGDPGMQSPIERAITVLFVACPSALLIASPTAMVAAFASAARLGVLVKEPRYLEAAGNVDTVVMDKTGTITTGKFAVARLVPAPGVEGAELLTAAATGEQQSNHPLARSIVTTAQAARVALDGAGQFEEIHGRGVKAQTALGTLHVGRASWVLENFPEAKDAMDQVAQRIEGMTGVHVVRDGRYLGAVGLEDRIRPSTKGVIDRLRELGIRKLSIFTGDRLSVAERVGRTVGVDSIEAECLPEEKHEQVTHLVKAGRRVLMVGDGINDGPSLASADVGVAMGLSGSDIATNSAGVALMNDDLSRIPFMIELSRKNRTIIAQNIVVAIGTAIVGLALAATGNLDIWFAALFHFLGDIFVVLNSFRLFRFGEQYHEQEAAAEQSVAQRRAASVRLGGAGSAGPAVVPARA